MAHGNEFCGNVFKFIIWLSFALAILVTAMMTEDQMLQLGEKFRRKVLNMRRSARRLTNLTQPLSPLPGPPAKDPGALFVDEDCW